MTSLWRRIVVNTVSGWDGVASIKGPNTYFVGLASLTVFLAVLFIYPDHSGVLASPLRSFSVTFINHSRSALAAEATLSSVLIISSKDWPS